MATKKGATSGGKKTQTAKKRTVQTENGVLSYFFVQRRGKTMRLSVHKTGDVYVKAPLTLAPTRADAFVLEHLDYVYRVRERLEAEKRAKAPVKEGSTVFFLGEKYTLSVTTGEPSLMFGKGFARLTVSPRTKDIASAYEKASTSLFSTLLLSRCQALEEKYPYLRGKAKEIRVRKMTTMWGNCRPQTGVLTFSLMLASMPVDLIDGVVAHEYTHLIQPNHDVGFYRELSFITPDYEERRRALNALRKKQEKER